MTPNTDGPPVLGLTGVGDSFVCSEKRIESFDGAQECRALLYSESNRGGRCMLVEMGDNLNALTYADERGEPFIDPVMSMEMMKRTPDSKC